MCGVDATVVNTIKSEAVSRSVTWGTTVTERWCSERQAVLLNFSLSAGDVS